MAKEVKLKLRFDISDLDSGNEQFKKKLVETAADIGAVYSIAKDAVGLLVDAIKGGIDVLTDWVKASDEEERQQRRTIALLRQRKELTQESIDALDRFNEAVRLETRASEGSLLTVQQTLAAMGVYRGDMEKGTLAALAFADAHGIGVSEAATVVGKLIEGNSDKLKQYGIYTIDARGEVDRLARSWRDAAQASDTLVGRIDLLRDGSADFGENLGAVINNSSELKGLIEGMTESAFALASFIKENQDVLGAIFDTGVRAAKLFIRTIPETVEFITGVLMPPLSAALTMMRTVANIGVAGFEAGQALVEGPAAPEQAGPPISASQRAAAARQAELDEASRRRTETENKKAAAEAALEARREQAKKEAEVEREIKRMLEKEHEIALEEQQESERRDREIARERLKARDEEIHEELRMEAQRIRDLREIDKTRLREQTQHANEANEAIRVDAQAKRDLMKDVGDTFGQGITSSLINAAAALGSGGDALLSAIGAAFGGMIVHMGEALAQAGIFAGVAALLGLIPILRPIFGEPELSAGAAVAAAAAGLTLIAVGSAMGGGGSRRSSGSGARGGLGGGGAGALTDIVSPDSGADLAHRREAAEQDAIRRGVAARNSGERRQAPNEASGPVAATYNVYFPRILGTDREIGREVNRLQQRGLELS